MNIAVLSGKGGTGKTFVSVNLAACAEEAVYLDCDVEEPNGHLFLPSSETATRKVYTLLPAFDEKKCTGCRKCVDFCRFNGLAFVLNKPVVFPEVCHSCGGCALVCPEDAVSEQEKEVGEVITGQYKGVKTVTGRLRIGEASGIPVIHEVLNEISHTACDIPVIIDCPPGSACAVMESLSPADYCLIVAEPTAFGLHNFKMVCELAELLHKPFGAVINKAPEESTGLDAYCREKGIPVLCKIPYRQSTAERGAKAEIAAEKDAELQKTFTALLFRLEKEVKK